MEHTRAHLYPKGMLEHREPEEGGERSRVGSHRSGMVFVEKIRDAQHKGTEAVAGG